MASVFGWQRSPGERAWQPSPVLLPGESHGQTSLAGYSPWGRKESGTTEHAYMDTASINIFFFILCIYLFIFGCAESSLLHGLFSCCDEQGLLCSCSVRVSPCYGSSYCGAWGSRGLGFSSVHRPSCSVACVIFLDRGSNPCLLH